MYCTTLSPGHRAIRIPQPSPPSHPNQLPQTRDPWKSIATAAISAKAVPIRLVLMTQCAGQVMRVVREIGGLAVWLRVS